MVEAVLCSLSHNFLLESIIVFQTIYCVVTGLLIIPTVLLSGISVLTVLKSSHLKEKLCYFLVLIQSIFGIAVGVIAVPANITLVHLNCGVSQLVFIWLFYRL